MLQFYQLNALNATIFKVQSRLGRYFSGKAPLSQLFFQFNVVNAAIFPVERRQFSYFSLLNVMNAAFFQA